VEALAHKHVREYIGATLMILLGIGAIAEGSRYSIGSLSRMGPGFFPVALGVILTAIGVVLLINARIAVREPPVKPLPPEWRGWACIVLAVIAFVVVGHYLGLVLATFAIVFISALGERENTWKSALALSLGMIVFCLVVFAWALQIQFPLFPWS
jgi:hypothetical protein